MGGLASIIHKPTGMFLWGANSNSENNDIGAEGVYTRRRRRSCTPGTSPVVSAVRVPPRSWRDHHLGRLHAGPGWSWRIHPHHGLGIVVPGRRRPTRCGMAKSPPAPSRASRSTPKSRAPRPPNGTSPSIRRSTSRVNLYAAYQHIEPEIALVTRDPTYSPTGKLKSVPIALEDFDVFFMGGRIQF